MSTALTECPRCTGKDGAHFAFCLVAEVWERLLGDRFPWAPPTPDTDCRDAWHEGYEAGLADAPLGPLLETDVDDDGWPDDEPEFDPREADPGVYEDFLVGSGLLESDADWMPHRSSPNYGEAARDDAHASSPGLKSVQVVTHLPENYFADKLPEEMQPPTPEEEEKLREFAEKRKRTYNTAGLDQAREERLRAMEDASVQFVYDRTDTVPGGRVLLSALHDEYDRWRKDNDRPSMSKDKLRDLLREMGLDVEPGRLAGTRKSGKAPLLVHGVILRQEPEVVPEPEPVRVVVKPKPKAREKHALIGSKPGGELPKQLRELIEPLITEQGWEYQPSNGSGKGKPRLITPDGKTVTLTSTPHLQGRALENTRSHLKANGAAL